jgi:hypothetical protein
MINLSNIDPVIVVMRTEPFDPDNSLLEIDCNYQPIRITSYVEHDPITRDDARGSVKPFYIGSARPFRLPYFVKPSIERRFERWLIPVPGPGLDELPQRPPGDNSHGPDLVCAHFGNKRLAQRGAASRVHGCFQQEE